MPTGTRPDAPEAPARHRAGRRAAVAIATLATTGLVGVGLFTATEATVAADGTLTEPFGALALGTLALTAAGLLGLGWLFRGVRRRSACGRGSC